MQPLGCYWNCKIWILSIGHKNTATSAFLLLGLLAPRENSNVVRTVKQSFEEAHVQGTMLSATCQNKSSGHRKVILEVDPVIPDTSSMTAALEESPFTTSWKTPSQNHLLSLFQICDPQELWADKYYYTKMLNFTVRCSITNTLRLLKNNTNNKVQIIYWTTKS